jgi:hypothetical protein
MSNTRYFHGSTDQYQSALGYWAVTDRHHDYAHTGAHARRVLYRFTDHTHPLAQKLVEELVNRDVEGLEALDTGPDLRRTYFTADYAPEKVIGAVDPALCGTAPVAVVAVKTVGSTLPEDGLPVQDLDFDYQSGAYAVYNWEVFYHVPFTIALHLSRNGRFAEAQHWYHYIFDPTDNSNPDQGPQRFWKVKPFKIDEVDRIEEILFNLATGDDPAARDSTARAIGAWRDSPFRPHLVARTRPAAYMYATVMAYLDNLIAWADSLFRQDTRESINEAMQLYVLAANILGPRPQAVPSTGSNKTQSYASLRNKLDEFSNAAVKLEAEIAFDLFPPPQPAATKPEQVVLQSIGQGLYFCIPRNEKLIGYWGTVADRLFKIRNSLNLQGTFRQLPLFPPPIDPAMLARAVAAGVDIGAIIDGTAQPPSPVRFRVLLRHALEMAQDVKSLGGQILAALEKKDAETLSVIRSKHEVNMLGRADSVKYAQWQEAIKNREGILANIQNAFQRFRHYDRLLGTEEAQIKLPDYPGLDGSVITAGAQVPAEPVVDAADPDIRLGESFRGGGHKISPEEAHEIDLREASQIVQDAATILEGIGAGLNLIPNVEAKVSPWGIGAGAQFGGSNVGHLFQGLAAVSRGVAGRVSHEAGLAATMGNFARREQDWAFQRKTAAGELTQLFKHLRSAEIREHIAKSEHEHHQQQIQESKDVLEFLTNEENRLRGEQRKTTTEDFYIWMKRESQGLHAKYFQFAYDAAKKAEHAFRDEIGDEETFIHPVYLTGKEGLFAGEKLYFDIKRLETAYAERDKRAFEITKHVSLREWFPLQLLELKETGECDISLPEELFDLDCPGHSHRRIKTVALSIPCVIGPYVSLNCGLTLTQSRIRRENGGYGNIDTANDVTNFTSYPVAVNSIVTSGAQNDTGMFDPNPAEEKYLAFEGAGAISAWHLELLGDPPQLDYDTISDAILTIRYSARAEGNKTDAQDAASNWLEQHAARAFSMRHEFGSQWAAFKGASGPPPDGRPGLRFALGSEHFPYRLETIKSQPKRLQLLLAGKVDGAVELFRKDKNLKYKSLGTANIVNGTAEIVPGAPGKPSGFDPEGEFELRFSSNALDDLWIVVDWSIKGA